MLARFAFGLLLAAGTCPPAVAQPISEPSPITTDPLSARPSPVPSATALLANDPVLPPANNRIDVIAGLPLAVRYQRRIGQSRFWGEAGAGLLLIVPDVFVGVRADWGLYEGRRNSFCVRPGLDAHLAVWPWGSVLGESGDRVAAAAGVALDADFVWRHKCDDGGRFELGLKLGVITLVGRDRALPLPTVGLLCGYRF